MTNPHFSVGDLLVGDFGHYLVKELLYTSTGVDYLLYRVQDSRCLELTDEYVHQTMEKVRG